MQTVAFRKTVLLVDDDANDVFFVQRAFEAAGTKASLKVVVDGQEAIDYLSGEGEFSQEKAHPIPSLIILDLKLPKIWGLEVLKWIREKPALQHLPVVVFTASDDAKDEQAAYRLGANSYFIKPNDMDSMNTLIPSLCEFWLEWNKSPRG